MIHEIEVPIYGVKFLFSFSIEDMEELDIPFRTSNVGGFVCTRLDDNTVIMYLNGDEKEDSDFPSLVFPSLAHEAVHAALEVFSIVGVDDIKVGDNNEHLTYLVGWIVSTVLGFHDAEAAKPKRKRKSS